jgi:hypothetical protein
MPGSVVDEQQSRWAVYLGYDHVRDGLFVLRPERKRPLRTLRLTAPDPAALPAIDIEGWLSQRAADRRDRISPREPAAEV